MRKMYCFCSINRMFFAFPFFVLFGFIFKTQIGVCTFFHFSSSCAIPPTWISDAFVVVAFSTAAAVAVCWERTCFPLLVFIFVLAKRYMNGIIAGDDDKNMVKWYRKEMVFPFGNLENWKIMCIMENCFMKI